MVAPVQPVPAVPPTEVPPKAKRRSFSVQDRLRILAAADACSNRGDLGALLRKEGIYSSLLSTWRKQRKNGLLSSVSPAKRGPAPTSSPDAALIAELKAQLANALSRAERAESLVELQKKIAELLGKPLPGSSEPR